MSNVVKLASRGNYETNSETVQDNGVTTITIVCLDSKIWPANNNVHTRIVNASITIIITSSLH